MENIEFITCDNTKLVIKLLPMICFSFFFENILIPVSKAFKVKDDNGVLGMRSSIISLAISLTIYIIILGAMSLTKQMYGRVGENNQLYISVYKDFDTFFSAASLLIMALMAQAQAQCYFQLALE
jgi:amino acid permease